MKLYKVFTAGKFPQGDVTEQDLKEIADNYDPDFHEAPLTLNHKSDGPAMGWVNKVVATGKDLFVGFKTVSDKAKEITGNGEYKRPSIEISNYDGKGKYLRAVSLVLFPAVKNLPDMQFKTADGGATIYFSEGEINFNSKNKNNNNMDLIKKFSEKLGLTADTATLEDVANTFNVKFDEKVSEIEALNSKIEALETEAKKFSEAQIDSLISNALASGKITKAQEESIKTFATSNFEACQTYVDSLPVKSIYEKDQSKQKLKDIKKNDAKYEDILKDPSLAANYSEEDLEVLRTEYLK